MATEPNNESEILLYQTEDGITRLEVTLAGDTVWLTQQQMAGLFQTTKQNIGQHLRNLFAENELREESVVKEFFTTAADGKNYQTKYYNLEVIIAVGYRVKSQRGTQFRQWATQRLSEYLAKGFVLDDERLKNPPGPGKPDYFNDLFERIRDIRASERRIYLRVREILALAADYQPEDADTQVFFQTVQNKLHYAVSGKTAPELIAERADASRANMGLTSWRGAVAWRGWGKPKGAWRNTDGQMSDTHGQGQVAQVARWLATLKASGCLCLLDGGDLIHFNFDQFHAVDVFANLTSSLQSSVKVGEIFFSLQAAVSKSAINRVFFSKPPIPP